MPNLLTTKNNPHQYIVVDQFGNVIIYFRLMNAAKDWIRDHQKDYMDNDLKIIKNDKL